MERQKQRRAGQRRARRRDEEPGARRDNRECGGRETTRESRVERRTTERRRRRRRRKMKMKVVEVKTRDVSSAGLAKRTHFKRAKKKAKKKKALRLGLGVFWSCFSHLARSLTGTVPRVKDERMEPGGWVCCVFGRLRPRKPDGTKVDRSSVVLRPTWKMKR